MTCVIKFWFISFAAGHQVAQSRMCREKLSDRKVHHLCTGKCDWRTSFISILFIVIFVIKFHPFEIGYERYRSNTKEKLLRNSNLSKADCRSSEGILSLLWNSSASHHEAKCLDGSSPAYYIRSGRDDGASKWLVHFEGGGWCFDLEVSVVIEI